MPANGCFRAFALLIILAWTAPGLAARSPTPPPLKLDDIGFVPAEIFDLRDGLPALSVVAAATTHDGEVWLGTMRGLVRYSSRRFVAEPGPDNALMDAIRDVATTPDGRLWASTQERGVFMRDAGRWRDVGRAAGLPADSGIRLRAFEQQKDYRLFVTGRGSLHEWKGERWQDRPLPPELDNYEIYDVLLQAGTSTDQDLLWLATFGKGLWRCRGNEVCEAVPMPEPGPRFNEISSLEHWIDPKDGSPVLWVGSYGGGLARLQHGRWQRLLADERGLPTNFVQRLLSQAVPGQAPHLWVGTRSGLAHRVGDRWVPLDAQARFEGSAVKALAPGRTARGTPLVWAGSDVGAARLQLSGPWRTITHSGRTGNGVWAVLHESTTDGEGFWIGTDGNGLLHYSAQGWQHFRVADGLPSDMVRTVIRDPDSGDLLVGTWGGELSRFDGKRFRIEPTPWPKSDHEAISAIRPDRDGAIWFLLRESGTARWKDGRWTSFSPKDGYPRRIYDLQRVGNSLWASTNTRGIARIDEDGWRYFGKPEGLPDVSFYGLSLTFADDARPILWAGSLRAGVVRIDVGDPDQPRLINTPALPTPPDRFVYEVLPDGRGNMFVSTNYGAALWRPNPNGTYTATNFHRADGLPHDESNYGALQVDAQRRIWLGTLGGLGVYTPPTTPIAAATPAPLVIENLRVDDRTLDLSQWKRTLQPLTGKLSVEMALRTGERESDIRYRSQMLGLEAQPTDWTADNRREFAALPAGDYRLRLEARDAAGVMAEPLELAVSIPLPFWRSNPALLLFALAGALLLFGLLRLRERQQRRRERHLVSLVRQRTHELETRGLELRRINEELTRLSYHDPLTDLANRRMLLERLHGEWELALARGTPLAFLLFDLDQFKAFNDQRGHLAGDECLREVGRRIDADLTSPDATAGRYGGEEFGVVLPGLTLDRAMLAAERLRHAVEQAGVSHPGTPQGVVTISVGVASMVPRAGFSAEVLIAAADAALYRAKEGGRNRVEAASADSR